MPAVKTQTAPALDRALSILELLAGSRAGLTLPDLVEQSRFPRSSVHYLLVTLQRRGYLNQNKRTRRYLFGTKLLDLTGTAMSSLSVRQQSTPILRRLARKAGLSAHLTILSQDEAVVVNQQDPPVGNGRGAWAGKRIELHSTAAGKTLLAGLPAPAVDRLLAERGLPRRNENTLYSPRRLREELVKINQSGYALEREEDELGVCAVAVPVRDASGRTIAALALSGDTGDLTSASLPALIRQLQQGAAEIAPALADEDLSDDCEAVDRLWKRSA